jgi:hypothetical protein
MKPILLVLTLLFPAAAHTQDVPLDEFVLIPVYSGGLRGAHGSIWTTELVIRNGNLQPLKYTPFHRLFPMFGPEELAPETSIHHDALLDRAEGRIMRLSTLEGVQFALRVRDLSRQSSSAGVEVPVVREQETRSRIVLPSVPVDDRFRHTLRIYDVSGVGTPNVRLRIYPFDSNVPVVDTTIPLLMFSDETTPSQITVGAFETTYPAFAGLEEARFEIDALTAGMRVWALVSTTNNETQEVTVVSPQ